LWPDRIAARPAVRRLLDLGGGPGTYAIHFCLAHPDLHAVIYDRPTTAPFAHATVDKFGLTGRIEFHPGDFVSDPIGGGPYDAAWLSHILHSNDSAQCRLSSTRPQRRWRRAG